MTNSATLSRLRDFDFSRANDLPRFNSLFIFGFDRDRAQSSPTNLLLSISNGALRGVRSLSDNEVEYRLTNDPALAYQLAELSFKASGARSAIFEGDSHCEAENIIDVVNGSLLVRARREQSEIYLLAGSAICDIDAPVYPAEPESNYYAALLPWLLYFRRSFGESCWHSPDSHAALIIDDPLIRPRYGFLRYDQLIDEMRVHGFKTAIAHIPWNYNRTNADTAAILRRNADSISLCVHGCDHTDAEFGTSDEQTLLEKTRTALEWSHRLQRQTDLVISPIMVFPQGVFSRAAILVLSREGFRAAINTSVFPTDFEYGDVRIRNLLDVAVTCYSAFPIFRRRYPFDVFPIAFDLFLGKPGFVAQHHIDFKDGYSKLTGYLQKLSDLRPRPSWVSLDHAVMHSGLQRRESAGRIKVKYYTDRFVLRNRNLQQVTYTLSKRIDRKEPVPRIFSDGNLLATELRNDAIEFELVLDAGQTANITTMRPARAPEYNISRTFGYETKIAARRFLSELRDNYLAQNDGLFRFSKMVRRVLPF